MVLSSTELSEKDNFFLDIAFDLAHEAIAHDEVPVGCVFVVNDKEIARGRNDVNRSKNPTRHAEMVALDKLKTYCLSSGQTLEALLVETTLYVSLEPCIMCACALYHLRIRRIIYGAANERFGGLNSVGSREKYGIDHNIEIVPDVRKSDAVKLLKLFYERQNPFCPEEKRKMKKKKVVSNLVFLIGCII